jgi:hypothetical protein
MRPPASSPALASRSAWTTSSSIIARCAAHEQICITHGQIIIQEGDTPPYQVLGTAAGILGPVDELAPDDLQRSLGDSAADDRGVHGMGGAQLSGAAGGVVGEHATTLQRGDGLGLLGVTSWWTLSGSPVARTSRARHSVGSRSPMWLSTISVSRWDGVMAPLPPPEAVVGMQAAGSACRCTCSGCRFMDTAASP